MKSFRLNPSLLVVMVLSLPGYHAHPNENESQSPEPETPHHSQSLQVSQSPKDSLLGWSQTVLDFAKSRPPQLWYSKSPNKQSIQGVSKSSISYPDLFNRSLNQQIHPALTKKNISVSTNHFTTGEMAVAYWSRCHSENRSECNKDLLVITAGLSAGLTSIFSHYAAQAVLHRENYDVLLIANSWSEDYLQFKPTASLADFEGEALALLEIISQAKSQIFEKTPTGELRKNLKTHIVGISYSAFLAVVASAKDHPTRATSDQEAQNEKPDLKPVIDGYIYGFSPIVKVHRSLTVLDSLIDQFQNSHQSPKVTLTSLGSVFWPLLVSENRAKTTTGFLFQKVLEESLLGMADNREILLKSGAISDAEKTRLTEIADQHLAFQLTQSLTDTNRQDQPTEIKNLIERYTLWQNQLKYLSAVSNYSSQNERYYRCRDTELTPIILNRQPSERGQQAPFCGDDLFFWINQAIAQGNGRLRIITTLNDELVDRNASSEARRQIETNWDKLGPLVIQLSTGGHAGYIGSEWLERVFDKALLAENSPLVGTYKKSSYWSSFRDFLKFMKVHYRDSQ